MVTRPPCPSRTVIHQLSPFVWQRGDSQGTGRHTPSPVEPSAGAEQLAASGQNRRPRCTPCVGLHLNTGRGDPESTWNTSGMLDSSFSEQPFRPLVAIPSLSLALILKCLARAA